MATSQLSATYRTAFVTGASAGLGRAFCEMLLAEGVRVWGTARDPARLGALAVRPGFTAVALDLADPEGAVRALAQATVAAGGAFDLVVQNAGFGVFGSFAATDFAIWQRQLDALLGATARLSHAALGPMLARGRGCLVHVTSLATDFPLPYMSGYNLAKAGLSALSESLVVETRGTGVTVIDFRPGDYRTDFNQAMHRPSATAPTGDPRLTRAWQRLEAHLQSAPPPARAAVDLRRALWRRRSGVVRSGGFFQACLAPAFAALLPAPVRRALAARYFGLR